MRTARMIFLAITLAVSICITGGIVHAATVLKEKEKGSQYNTPPPFAPDQVIVAFKPGTPGEAKRAAHAQAGGRVIRTLGAIGAELVGIPTDTVLDKIAVYKHNPNVRYAEPNYYRTLTEVPSEGLDPNVCSGGYFDEQWYLHNTGQSFLNDIYTGPCALTGVEDADIDWLEAYEAGSTGRSSVKIATVDSGVEWTHPDLANKIVEAWAAPGVISAGEGPEDNIGHGTHVAGIAAADTNNGYGIAGVGGDASIGSLKVCHCTAMWCLAYTCEDADIVAAISHAIDNDYNIINMSLGGPAVGQAIQDAVEAAFAAGLILVAGAGNNYQLNPPNHFYPADCEGVISVAATDHFDNIASFSNFGPGVDVAAPGTSILSTYPASGCGDPDCYNWLDGTSMATPVVSGAAALVLDSIAPPGPVVPSVSLRDQVINALLNNADHTGALGQNMLAWTRYGRLNLYSALTGGGAVCGDGMCDAGEDPCSCPDDCDTPPSTEATCNDGVDNDCDGASDCDDADCEGDPACCTPVTEVCNDSVDNDCDGFVDCDDADCEGDPACCTPVTEVCNDGVDNDCDGASDCDDADCAGDPACCSTKGSVCASDSDCCSGKCRGGQCR